MSLDFSQVREISDSYGKIVKIADAQGRVLWSAVKPLISFTIEEGNTVVNYQAALGMTWGEWVDSEYNPSADYTGTVKAYSVNRDMIQNDNANLYVYVPTDYSFPSPSDLIIANFAYQLAKD